MTAAAIPIRADCQEAFMISLNDTSLKRPGQPLATRHGWRLRKPASNAGWCETGCGIGKGMKTQRESVQKRARDSSGSTGSIGSIGSAEARGMGVYASYCAPGAGRLSRRGASVRAGLAFLRAPGCPPQPLAVECGRCGAGNGPAPQARESWPQMQIREQSRACRISPPACAQECHSTALHGWRLVRKGTALKRQQGIALRRGEEWQFGNGPRSPPHPPNGP